MLNNDEFLSRSIWPRNDTVAGTTTTDQSGPGSNEKMLRHTLNNCDLVTCTE